MFRSHRTITSLAILTFVVVAGTHSAAQRTYTPAQFLSPAYPFELVSARDADRIAWIAYDQGRRNVYTAAAPQFRPVRLTSWLEDNGIDLTSLSISADGSTVVFVRGHAPNRDGWVANPTTEPRGADRTLWAARTAGGRPWRLGPVTGTPALSPDGHSVVFMTDGQIYRYPIKATPVTAMDKGEEPFLRVWGTNSNPTWSPDGSKLAFVSDRDDHSYIGLYDFKTRKVTYVAPDVDRDTSPAWSADSRRIAFIRRPGAPFGQQIQQAAAAAAGRGGRGRAGAPGRGGRGRGGDEGDPSRPGLTRATFTGGYTLSFWVADVVTGEAREVWHNEPDEQTFRSINRIQWAGDHLIFQLEPEEWVRHYSVSANGGTTDPIVLTPGEGMAEFVALSRDGRDLY
jgi:dipeptidyl aminopeptidase/acylaminoacyl peptidase